MIISTLAIMVREHFIYNVQPTSVAVIKVNNE